MTADHHSNSRFSTSSGAPVEMRFELAIGPLVLRWRLVADGDDGALLHSGPASPPASSAIVDADPHTRPHRAARRAREVLDEARTQLLAYGRGELRRFDLPLRPRGTAFQQRVWQSLRELPWGATLGYGLLAVRIGSPGAARAVGQACSANPLLILLPCHRVRAASGRPLGFAGGPELGRALHDLEIAGQHAPDAACGPDEQRPVGVNALVDPADRTVRTLS